MFKIHKSLQHPKISGYVVPTCIITTEIGVIHVPELWYMALQVVLLGTLHLNIYNILLWHFCHSELLYYAQYEEVFTVHVCTCKQSL